jgi:hypothetical protein
MHPSRVCIRAQHIALISSETPFAAKEKAHLRFVKHRHWFAKATKKN